MNYIFAGAILLLWYVIIMSSGWDPKISKAHNILISLFEVVTLGVIYWIPFWLISLR